MNWKKIALSLVPLVCFSCAQNSSGSFEESSFESSLENSSSVEVSSESLVESSSSFEESSKESSSSPVASSSIEKPKHAYNGEFYGSDDFKELFDHESDIKISVSMTDASARFMNDYQYYYDSTLNDVYVPADIKFNVNGKETLIEEVGIRMKGNTSRRQFFVGGAICYSFHFKISFKATFDSDLYNLPETSQFKKTWATKAERKARKNRQFCGMDKLDFKYLPRNWRQGYPGTNSVEIYAYDSFIKAGLLAPYSHVSNMTIKSSNSSFSYLCQIVEPIDKCFLEKRFLGSEADGDLYKCAASAKGWATLERADAVEKIEDEKGYNIGGRVVGGKIGVEDCYNRYRPCYDLKTNDDGENSDFSNMVRLINTLHDVAQRGATKEHLEEVVDADYFLAYSAMSVILGNPDDLRYNANNYYIYFLPSTKKALFIPYDYDWCLGWYWDGCHAAHINATDIWNESHGDGYPRIMDTMIYKTQGNVSYSKKDYQTTYKRYVLNYLSELGILEFDNYKLLSFTLAKTQRNEFSVVEDYMESKFNAIVSNLSV